MKPSEVAKSIDDLTNGTDEEQRKKIESWLFLGLKRLTPEKLQYAIDNYVDPVSILGNHLKLENAIVKPLARILIRSYWKDIEPLLTNVSKMYTMLAEDPKKKRILDMPTGRRYLNWCAKRYYSYLYNYCWR